MSFVSLRFFNHLTLRLLPMICLLGGFSHAHGATVDEFSGPQVGETLPTFESKVLYGPSKAKTIEVGDTDDPQLLIFVHELNRPAFGLMRSVANYAKKREKDGLKVTVVFLGNDPTDLTTRLQRAARALPPKINVAIYGTNVEGPGSYGLNRKMQITALVANKRKVTANFAIVQPGIATDAPKIAGAVAKALGDKKSPTLAELGVGRMRRNTEPENYRALISPVIQKTATDQQIDKAARKLEQEMKKNPALRTKVYQVTNRIIDAGKLDNYGTERTHFHFKKWARELKPEKSKPDASKPGASKPGATPRPGNKRKDRIPAGRNG